MRHVEASYCLFGFCESMIDFRKFCNMRGDRPFVWNKWLEAVWARPHFGRGKFSGNHLGGATCVIQDDEDSVMVTFCIHILDRGGLNQTTVDTTSTSLEEKIAPQSSPWSPATVPPISCWRSSNCCPSVGTQSKWDHQWVSLRMCPFKKSTTPGALCVSQNLHWFLQPKVGELLFLALEP